MLAQTSLAQLAGRKLWEFDTESPIDYPPAINSDGAVYFTASNTLFCLEQDGRPRWLQNISGYPMGPPVISDDDGVIYLSASTGAPVGVLPSATFSAFWLADGSLRWRLFDEAIGERYSGTVAPAWSANDSVFFASNGIYDGTLKVLASDGRVRWNYRAGPITDIAIGRSGRAYLAMEACISG